MKTTSSIAQLISLCCVVATASAQGTFQNLDFESATIVPIPGDSLQRVEVAPAFSGWTIAGGLSGAMYHRRYLDSTGISIMDDPNCPFGCLVLEGRYTAVIQAMDELRKGAIGRVYLAESWYQNNRGTIGRGKVTS